MDNMKIIIIGVVAFGVTLLALYFSAGSVSPSPTSPSSRPFNPESPVQGSAAGEVATASGRAVPVVGTDVASLTQQVARLQRAQGDLEKAVARLERRLAGVKPDADAAVLAVDESTSADLAATAEADARGATPADIGPPNRVAPKVQLLAAGFTEAETDAIIQAVDENTLERLQLRYRAARGGDDGRSARAALRELPRGRDRVRDEFGEDAYDRYLYATGQPNRIVVEGVLETSPAQSAGIAAGDTLLQLDDQPVYAVADLMRIGAAGGEADQVSLTVLRAGEILQVSVPRGPLGINASADSVDPAVTPSG